jgi:hypothetical protein
MKSLKEFINSKNTEEDVKYTFPIRQLEENVLQHLNNIVNNHQAKSIKFKDGSSMKVDVQTAHAILKVHGAVNHENKEKIANMAHKSKSHFKKVADFAWKHTTYKSKD